MVLHLYQKSISFICFLRCHKRVPIFYRIKVHFVDTLPRRTYFWDTAGPCGSSHSIRYTHATIKKVFPESIRAIARSPNIDLQSIGIYFKSDIQHHIRTQQFQELLAKMDTIQRHSTDQNLRKFAETAVFSDI